MHRRLCGIIFDGIGSARDIARPGQFFARCLFGLFGFDTGIGGSSIMTFASVIAGPAALTILGGLSSMASQPAMSIERIHGNDRNFTAAKG
jgi:hypothetical protein